MPPQFVPGKRASSDSVMGYGYLWWVPETVGGPYSAIGIFTQFVYVDHARGMVNEGVALSIGADGMIITMK